MRRSFFRDERANAAVEFAIIVPVLFTLILGIISMSTMYFSQSSLHTAAEWAARKWAVSDAGWTISGSCTFCPPGGASCASPSPPMGCTSASTGFSKPADYATQHYYGVGVPTFTPKTGVCTQSSGTFGSPGVIVTASETYNFNAMFLNLSVPMGAQACYPIIQ